MEVWSEGTTGGRRQRVGGHAESRSGGQMAQTYPAAGVETAGSGSRTPRRSHQPG